jgi:hypothetical protein
MFTEVYSWHFNGIYATGYCHVIEWLQTEFGFVIGFIEHLQLVSTSNYSAIANSHTLEFTIAHTTFLNLLCTPWKFTSDAEKLVLQILQFPGGPCISHSWSNQCFMESYFNVDA